MKPKIKELIKTLTVSPSQWEGTLDDGRMFYIRYRWGNFNVYVSKEPTTDVFDAVDGENILSIENHGEQFDGYMEDEIMLNLIKDIFDYEQTRNG
jgi:hypothetical protein